MFVPPRFSSVQSLSSVRLFATPWTAARQASLSITNPRSLLKFMPIELVMPSNRLILCCFNPTTPLICRSPNPQSVRVWRWLGYEGGGWSQLGRISALRRGDWEASSSLPSLPPPPSLPLPSSSSHLKIHPGGSCPQARRCLLTGHWIFQGFDFGFPASRNVSNKYLLSQPIYDIFDIATWTKTLT